MPTSKQSPLVAKGPVEKYGQVLNTVLAALLAVGPVLTRGQQAVEEGALLLSILPACELYDSRVTNANKIVGCVLVWGLNSELRNVDVEELSKLKYGYKGA
jgi:hypothetical protein